MTKTFTFTDRDLQILTNFSEICPHIEFRKGRRQATTETNRSLVAFYDFDTEIKNEFCIYDLPEFLNLIDLFENPKITLNENKLLLKEDKLKIVYPTSETNTIIKPNYPIVDKTIKNFNEKDNDIEFDLTADDIREIYRLNRKIKLPDIAIENDEGNIALKLFAKNQYASSTTLTHILNQKTNQSFKLNFRFHRFKFLISDYKVEIQKFSKSGIVRLSSKEIPLTYEFALEEDSIFDSNESEVINNA